MKFASIILNGLLFIVTALICIVCISDYFEKGDDTFSTFLESFSVMVFAILNMYAITSDD